MTTSLGFCGLVGALAGLVMALVPTEVDACGGTFCDSGPQAMPVDQTGENILFVMDGSYVEAHIQIQYDPNTDAAKFAWVVPVQEIPQFSVGSNAMFDNLLSATVPSYGFTTSFDGCGDPGGEASGGDGGDSGGFIDPPDGGSIGPDVVFEDVVGAFSVVVLSGGTSDEVMQWLANNGYQQDPNAEPILREYLQEGFMFAAFKLTNGADVDEIHPVTLRFDGISEACVPLRLTRIAAQDDMEVRTFFLSDHRVVPSTYRHVLVNPVKLQWSANGGNYKELVTMAVDAENADGRAFVTEYGGTSDVVSRAGLWDGGWQAGPFLTVEPRDIISTLQSQGMLWCDSGMCEFYHPLIEGLLGQFLPAPMSVPRDEFYSCLSCYEGLIDLMAWDAATFATAYQERIIDPGAYATTLLQTWPYLTRMYTTISPGEMTEDPFFYQNPDLPDVTNMQQFAQQRVLCDGDAVWTLPDGREVYVPAGESWPAFPAEMPWVEDVERMLPAGAPENLADNTTLIDEELAKHNCQYDWPSADECGNGTGTGSDGDSGPTTDSDTNGDSGPSTASDSGQTSVGTSDTETAGGDGGATTTRGCACDAGSGGAGGAMIVLGLLGVTTGRRRRV